MADKRLLLGLGTGRCGTVSLARLLHHQSGFDVSHEMARVARSSKVKRRLAEPLAWLASEEMVDSRIALIFERNSETVGDVGSSWLPHVPRLLERFVDMRVLCLERPQEEVVGSFLRKAGNRNHWSTDPLREVDERWDPVFPNYDEAGSVAAAVSGYWRDYHAAITDLCDAEPDRVRRWSMDEALNTEDGLTDVLAFAGVPAARQRRPRRRRFNEGVRS